MTEVQPGFYNDFKGDLYRIPPSQERTYFVHGDGPKDSVGAPLVTYTTLNTTRDYKRNTNLARTIANFREHVYVNGQSRPRFQQLAEPSLPSEYDPLGQHTETIFVDAEQSFAFDILHGVAERRLNRHSTTTYEVLAGRGGMEVDGIKHSLIPGSVVTVAAGTPYQEKGRVVMAATSIPPYNPEDVESAPQPIRSIDPEDFRDHPFSMVFFRDDDANATWYDRSLTGLDLIFENHLGSRRIVNPILGAVINQRYRNTDNKGHEKQVRLYAQGITIDEPAVLKDVDRNPLLNSIDGIRNFGAKSAKEFAEVADIVAKGQFLPPQFHDTLREEKAI